MNKEGKKSNKKQIKQEKQLNIEIKNDNNLTTDILLTTQKDRSNKKTKTKSMKQKKANFDVSSTKKQFGVAKKPKATIQQIRVQNLELKLDFEQKIKKNQNSDYYSFRKQEKK